MGCSRAYRYSTCPPSYMECLVHVLCTASIVYMREPTAAVGSLHWRTRKAQTGKWAEEGWETGVARLGVSRSCWTNQHIGLEIGRDTPLASS
ncbi:hypothetical protein V8C42DRAFT_307803 [Trichoderma barbatum]